MAESPGREYAIADLKSAFADNQAGDFARRLQAISANKRLNQRRLSDLSAISPGRINEYWNGKREPGAANLFALADVLEIDARELLTGVPGTGLSESVRRHTRKMAESEELDLVSVNEIDMEFGLGGTFTDVPIETKVQHFDREWLRSITATPPAKLTWTRGRGDSMGATVQDGDLVLIDLSQKTVREQDLIWAFTIGDIGMIKRLRVRGGEVTILSDNNRVPPDTATPGEINVVGRVVFIGRKI